MRRLLLLALLVAAPALAQPDLGTTSFANSGAPEAQEPFLRGLLLLHSFEYDDAREAFQEAREIDPGFAMAAWGEAMTHNHPVWQRQDRDAALAALGPVVWQALSFGFPIARTTAREARYLQTLYPLFRDGEKEGRDDAYAEAMRELAEAYPDDLDARAFYALALLGTAHEGRDFSTYMRAAAVAEEVFAENPQHPGAAHYLIHAYDDPVHAPLGLRPARVYADVAPAASHALHMPSHIYLALGLWDDVAAMNERSFLAAKAGTDARGEALNGHGWHALWWWNYAALQLADDALVARTLALADDLADSSPSAVAHRVRIGAQVALLADDPATVTAALPAPPSAEAGVSTLAIDALARGLLALQAGDAPAAQDVLAGLEAALVDAVDAPWHARAGALILASALSDAGGDPASALEALREAARLEREAPLAFGPPTPVVQANEYLGRALLDHGEPQAAIEAFQAALDRAPGRRIAVEWLAVAQQAVRVLSEATGGE